MIDLIALKDFLVLCQTRSFSRAAEHCHVSISGLSRRIQGLEQWLGTAVFSRNKAALELTEAGRQLQAVAAEVVYALEGLRKTVKNDRDDRQSRIRFAAPHVMSAIFFSEWVSRLHNDFRSARFSVDSDNLPDCFDMLDAGSADYVVGLFDTDGEVMNHLGNAFDAGHYFALDLGRERLVPVSVPDATGRARFDLGNRKGDPVSFLAYADECHLGWSLRRVLDDANLPALQQNHASSLTDGIRMMALSGLGLAWLPLTLVRDDLNAKRLVRAGPEKFDVPLCFTLWRRPDPLGAEAEKLWLYLRERVAAPSERLLAVG